MPAQLGNALTQMMQLKGMRAQNKLAEYQMEQAKAAQAQQQAQQVALQKVFTEYGDPNIAEIGQYNPQVGFALIEMKNNLNQVDPTVIENQVKMSSMIDQAASGGVATYSTLQQLVPQLKGKPYDPQLIAQIVQRNKPYLAALQDMQTAKDKPKYTLINDDGSTQVVEVTTIADKNKYDAMVKAGTARYGEYKAATQLPTERERFLKAGGTYEEWNNIEAKLAAAKNQPDEKQKSIDALVRTFIAEDPSITKDAARAKADRRYAELYSTKNIINIDTAGNEVYTEKQLIGIAEAAFDAKVIGDTLAYEMNAKILTRNGYDMPPMDDLPKNRDDFMERFWGWASKKTFGNKTTPGVAPAPVPSTSPTGLVDDFIRDNK